MLDALLDAGADIDATGAVIADGTPLDDAVGFGQWNAARRLVERGAHTTLGQAAALGLLDRLKKLLATEPTATADEVNAAFWGACHGGQQGTAEHLLTLGRGPGLGRAWDGHSPIDAARRSGADTLVAWLLHRGATSAR